MNEVSRQLAIANLESAERVATYIAATELPQRPKPPSIVHQLEGFRAQRHGESLDQYRSCIRWHYKTLAAHFAAAISGAAFVFAYTKPEMQLLGLIGVGVYFLAGFVVIGFASE
jgi:hypothetical protein